MLEEMVEYQPLEPDNNTIPEPEPEPVKVIETKEDGIQTDPVPITETQEIDTQTDKLPDPSPPKSSGKSRFLPFDYLETPKPTSAFQKSQRIKGQKTTSFGHPNARNTEFSQHTSSQRYVSSMDESRAKSTEKIDGIAI